MKKLLKIIVLPIVVLFSSFGIFRLGLVKEHHASNSYEDDFELFSTQIQRLISDYETGYYDDLSFNVDEELTTINNTLMVRSDIYRQATGVGISIDGDTYTIRNSERAISLSLDDNVMSVDDDMYIAKQPAEEVDGEIYLPIEDVSAILGYDLRFQDNELYLSRPYATRRIIVKSSSQIDNCGATNVVEGYNNLHIFQYETESDTREAIEYFSKLDNIDWYQVDNIVTTQNIEEDDTILGLGDTYSYTSWGAESMGIESYSGYLINTVGMSNLNDVVIAVLDTGIDTDHSWFANRIVAGGRNFSSSTSTTAYEYEDVLDMELTYRE